MVNVIIGIVLVVFGCYLIINRRQFLRDSMAFQTKYFKIRYNKNDWRVGIILEILFGVIIAILGVLVTFGLWEINY